MKLVKVFPSAFIKKKLLNKENSIFAYNMRIYDYICQNESQADGHKFMKSCVWP